MRYAFSAAICCLLIAVACEGIYAARRATSVYENGEIVRPVGANCVWCGYGATVERESVLFVCKKCHSVSTVRPHKPE